MMDQLIGKVVRESYRILHRLSEGEMGVSYEAERLRSAGGPALVRVFHPAAIEDRRAYSRYIMEAELVASLDHPHVVGLEDFGELEDGRPYVATELLVGEDLARRLERRGPLPAKDVACLLEQAGGALQMMHQQGILHRDLNPGRIFLVRSKEARAIQVKVVDFGISRLRMNLRLTRQEVSLESMQFMSPEQVTGDTGKVARCTDVFALAPIAYNALSGRLPFQATSAAGLLGKICSEEPTPITDLLPDLSPDLHRVLSKGMAKQGDDRYQEALQLAEDFHSVLAGKAPAHLGDWQPPRVEPPEPEHEPEPEPVVAPAPPPQVKLPPPVVAPRASGEPSQPSIVLSPQLPAFSEPPPFHEAKTEQVRSTAVMDVEPDDLRRRAERDRITEEQEPVFEEAQQVEQKPATGILAVDELEQVDLGKTMVEEQPPTTGFLAVDELEQGCPTEAAPAADEKQTVEMSGPEILALQQEDTFMLNRDAEQGDAPARVAADKETVKIEAPSPAKDEEAPAGINLELMKTVREPD